jgi:hypothetical protein
MNRASLIVVVAFFTVGVTQEAHAKWARPSLEITNKTGMKIQVTHISGCQTSQGKCSYEIARCISGCKIAAGAKQKIKVFKGVECVGVTAPGATASLSASVQLRGAAKFKVKFKSVARVAITKAKSIGTTPTRTVSCSKLTYTKNAAAGTCAFAATISDKGGTYSCK